MNILRCQVHIGDIINNSSIVTYIGKYGFTTLEFATNRQHSHTFERHFGEPKYLNITRTGLTTIEQITSNYPELFI